MLIPDFTKTDRALEPRSTGWHRPRPPFERIALALQGGGALGAYQGGVYQALAEADLHPVVSRWAASPWVMNRRAINHPAAIAVATSEIFVRRRCNGLGPYCGPPPHMRKCLTAAVR